MFALLFPWACGTHSDVLASRLFQLLDENGDSLINFREFVSGLSKDVAGLHGLGGANGVVALLWGQHGPRRLGLGGRAAHFRACKHCKIHFLLMDILYD